MEPRFIQLHEVDARVARYFEPFSAEAENGQAATSDGEMALCGGSSDSALWRSREGISHGEELTLDEAVRGGEGSPVETKTLRSQPDVEAFAGDVQEKLQSVWASREFSFGFFAMPTSALALLGCMLAGEFVWAGVCLFAIIAISALVRRAERQTIDRASRWNYYLDAHALPILSAALEWPDRRVQSVAASLLLKTLSELKPGEPDLLDQEARNCLYRQLTVRATRSNPKLALAILRALPLLGTEGALPYISRWAARRAFTPNARRIRKAARAALPLLEERVAGQRAALALSAKAASSDNSPSGEHLASELAESEGDARATMSGHLDEQMRELEAEWRKVSNPGMRQGYLLASWLVIVPFCAFHAFDQFAAGHWSAGLLLGMLTAAATQLHRLTLGDKHMFLARRLSKMDDVHCIGRLASMLDWPDRNVRKLAMAALARLLPRVSASDRMLLTPGQRASLHRLLVLSNANAHSRMLLSILKALEQIGDASSIPIVERLANELPATQQQQIVRDAATNCLPYLMTRSELNHTSQTLLRASSINATGAEQLLRAAHPTDNTDPETLLRAGSSVE